MDYSDSSKFIVSALLNSAHFVAVGFFRDVKNAAVVREKLVNGTLEAAVIDCRLILDPFQVLVAANKAWQTSENGAKKTKTVFSEVLYSLSISGNISDCFKKFGVSDKSTDIVVVTFEESEDTVKFQEVKTAVDGSLSPFTDLCHVHNVEDIKQYYKVTEEELSALNLLNCVVTRLATKDYT